MTSAGNKCPDWSDHRCFTHTLQLCIKPALEIPTVAKLISRSRKLVGHFKHSTTVAAELRKRQQIFQLPQHELIQDVTTRWNSTQMMMERLVKQRRVISDIMLDQSVTKRSDVYMLLKESEWESLSDISNVLEKLTQITTYMSTESMVSASVIYPIVCGLLQNHLCGSDSSIVSKIKQAIASELNSRFQPDHLETASTVPVLSYLLNPRHKHLNFLFKPQKKLAIDSLESELDEVPLKPALPPAQNKETTEECLPPKAKSQRMLDFLIDGPSDKHEESEVSAYLREFVNRDDEDSISWLK